MKIIEIIKSLDSYERFLVENEASISKISHIKNTKDFFYPYSDMTLQELDLAFKKASISKSETTKNKNSDKPNEVTNNISKAIALYKKRIDGLKLNNNELLFIEKFEIENPRVIETISLTLKDLSNFFYSQNFMEWKVSEIKFVIVFFFGNMPNGKRNKKALIDFLQSQLFQNQYINDLYTENE